MSCVSGPPDAGYIHLAEADMCSRTTRWRQILFPTTICPKQFEKPEQPHDGEELVFRCGKNKKSFAVILTREA